MEVNQPLHLKNEKKTINKNWIICCFKTILYIFLNYKTLVKPYSDCSDLKLKNNYLLFVVMSSEGVHLQELKGTSLTL